MPKIKLNKDKYIIVYDIENEVIKPFNMGYYREAFAKLDSILESVIEHMLKRAFPSKDANRIISNMAKARCYPSQMAYALGLLKRTWKTKIDRFKSMRNAILHNSYGELSLLTKKKINDLKEIHTILMDEIKTIISLIQEMSNST